MKKKNIIILLVVLMLGSIAGWLVYTKSSKNTIKKELRDFAVSDTTTINKIFLADKNNNSVMLEKVDDEWKVNGQFYARKDVLNTLLSTIKSLEVLSPVGKNARETIIKSLAAKSVKVEIYQNNKLTKLYYVGGETQDQEGTYMLLADPETGKNSSVPFAMFVPGFTGYLTTRYLTNEEEWRERVVFRYLPNNIRSVKVDFSNHPEHSYEILNDGNNSFSIKTTATLSTIDTLAIKQYLSYFQDIQYESLLNKFSKKDSVLATAPISSITVTDNKNTVSKIIMFNMPAEKDRVGPDGKPLKFDPDRMYALINGGKDFCIIQYFVFGKLIPTPDYFSKKK